MALKDIFNMIKADRYTADGREELIKAHAEETEDRTYNIGEISQKTGLQKTANGWVKPKKGGKITPKGKDLMERASKNPNLTEHGRAAASKLAKEYNEKLNGSSETAKKEESKSVAKFDEYGLPSNETIAMKDKFLKEENVTDPSKLTNAEFNALAEKLDKKLGINNKERAQELLVAESEQSNPYEMTEAEKKESMKDPGTRLSQKYDAVLKTKKGTPEHDKAMSEYLAERDSYKESQGAEAAKKFPVDPLQGTGDSAPRVLTGDTKIRIRK